MDWPTAILCVAAVICVVWRWDAAYDALQRFRIRHRQQQIELAHLDQLHSALVGAAARGDEHSGLMLEAASAIEDLAMENGRLKALLSERPTAGRER